MFQAITTKYHGPSSVKDARVSASAAAGRIILNWDHSLNIDHNHQAAAKAFADKLGWKGRWFGGVTKDGSFVFVCSDNGVPDFV